MQKEMIFNFQRITTTKIGSGSAKDFNGQQSDERHNVGEDEHQTITPYNFC